MANSNDVKQKEQESGEAIKRAQDSAKEQDVNRTKDAEKTRKAMPTLPRFLHGSGGGQGKRVDTPEEYQRAIDAGYVVPDEATEK